VFLKFPFKGKGGWKFNIVWYWRPYFWANKFKGTFSWRRVNSRRFVKSIRQTKWVQIKIGWWCRSCNKVAQIRSKQWWGILLETLWRALRSHPTYTMVCRFIESKEYLSLLCTTQRYFTTLAWKQASYGTNRSKLKPFTELYKCISGNNDGNAHLTRMKCSLWLQKHWFT